MALLSRIYFNAVFGALGGLNPATLAGSIPLSPNGLRQTVIPEGYQFTKGQETVTELSSVVDERYFDTMQVPIVRGRAFNTSNIV